MAVNQVQFYSLTEAQYNAKTPKNASDLYFLDNGRLYKGTVLMGNNFHLVGTTYPEVGKEGILYLQPSTGMIKVWNGTSYLSITKELVTTLSEDSPNDQAPSAKAVWEALQSLTPEGLPELMTQVGVNTQAIANITNPETGILKQAQLYTDAVKQTVEQHTSQIQGLSNSKADKSTTLDGYGIDDAYTKTEVDTLVQTQIAASMHLKKEIVNVLPDESEAKDNIIYMVPKTTAEGNQAYDEFMLINGKFEKIGDTEVDLSSYATKSEVTQQVGQAVSTAAQDAQNKANAAKEQAIQAASQALTTYATTNDAAVLKNKQDIEAINDANTGIFKRAQEYANSLGANYATKAQGELADSALQPKDIATGYQNGSISVDGTDVLIKGLGSAAFTESSAYDPANSATTAYNNAVSYVDGLLTWKFE